MANKNEYTFDVYFAPADRNIRAPFQLQEVEGMARETEEVMKGKQDGKTMTHASDSTTKRKRSLSRDCTWARTVIC